MAAAATDADVQTHRRVGDKELVLTKQMIDERTALDVESIAREVDVHSLIVHGDADNTTPFVCSWGLFCYGLTRKRLSTDSNSLLMFTICLYTARLGSCILPW